MYQGFQKNKRRPGFKPSRCKFVVSSNISRRLRMILQDFVRRFRGLLKKKIGTHITTNSLKDGNDWTKSKMSLRSHFPSSASLQIVPKLSGTLWDLFTLLRGEE